MFRGEAWIVFVKGFMKAGARAGLRTTPMAFKGYRPAVRKSGKGIKIYAHKTWKKVAPRAEPAVHRSLNHLASASMNGISSGVGDRSKSLAY